MKSFLVFLIPAVFIAEAALAQDCKPQLTFPTIEEGYITVAATTYPPYSFISPDGVVKGVDGDIISAIADMACKKVRPLPADSASAIQSVISDRADLAIGAWYRTAARAQVVSLSNPLYLDQIGVYSFKGYDSFSQIENGTVGSLQGSLWVADVQAFMGDNLRLYPDTVAMQQDVMSGRVDALVDGYSMGVVAQQEGRLKGLQVKILQPDKRVAASIEAGQGAFPINPNNDEMLAAINSGIATLHENGTVAKILSSYGLDPSAADTGEPRLIK